MNIKLDTMQDKILELNKVTATKYYFKSKIVKVWIGISKEVMAYSLYTKDSTHTQITEYLTKYEFNMALLSMLKLAHNEHHNNKYKEAYNILMCYFDAIPDDDKPIVDKQLKELDL